MEPCQKRRFSIDSRSARAVAGDARVGVQPRSFSPIAQYAMQIKEGGLRRNCPDDRQSECGLLESGIGRNVGRESESQEGAIGQTAGVRTGSKRRFCAEIIIRAVLKQ